MTARNLKRRAKKVAGAGGGSYQQDLELRRARVRALDELDATFSALDDGERIRRRHAFEAAKSAVRAASSRADVLAAAARATGGAT